MSRTKKGEKVMYNYYLPKLKLILAVLVGLAFILVAKTSFAAPPPPSEPVPLFGEEILIPTLVGYGLYRLRKKSKQG